MKLFAFVLAILMCLGAFAACGSDNGDGKSTDDGNGKDPVDTIYDVGDITVAVPEGWMAFNNTDIHADEAKSERRSHNDRYDHRTQRNAGDQGRDATADHRNHESDQKQNTDLPCNIRFCLLLDSNEIHNETS